MLCLQANIIAKVCLYKLDGFNCICFFFQTRTHHTYLHFIPCLFFVRVTILNCNETPTLLPYREWGTLVPDGRFFGQITQTRPKNCQWPEKLEAVKWQNFAKTGRKESGKYFYKYLGKKPYDTL
jgi:hypothetical protein